METESPRSTLRDVAQLAGVSLSTASRVLHGTGGRVVSTQNQTLVRDAARQLHYRSSRDGSLRTRGERDLAQRAGSIGLVLRAAYRYTDPFWSPVLEGLTEEVLRQGYHIRFSFIAGDLAHDRRRRLLAARHVDGLILIGDVKLADEIVGMEPPEHIVIIAGHDLGHWEGDIRFDVVTMEKLAAMDRLIAHLAAQGHRRLGFLGPAPDQDRRGEGFLHALSRQALPFTPQLYMECDFGVDTGYAAASLLLRSHAQSLDGLVCACDTIAIGAMRAAKECGLRLPGDLAICGFDNIAFSQDLEPPLTTVQVPKELMGALAARRLIERIRHPDWPPIIQTAPTQLIVRQSCGELVAGPEALQARPLRRETGSVPSGACT